MLVYHVDRLTRRPVELEEFVAAVDAAASARPPPLKGALRRYAPLTGSPPRTCISTYRNATSQWSRPLRSWEVFDGGRHGVL